MFHSKFNVQLLALFATLSLALTGCTENGRALVPVNVSLASGVNAVSIASLEIIVSDDSHPLERREAPYTADAQGVSRFGIYVDIESETNVAVTVRATDAQGVEVASGGSDEVLATPGGTSAPANVVLWPSNGNDGGTNPDVSVIGSDSMPLPAVDGGITDTIAIPDAPVVVIPPDPKWAAAVNQEDDGSDYSIDPRVAVAPSGDAIVVWTESNRVKSKKYTASTGVWSNIKNIDNRPYPQSAVIGIDGNGRAIVAWTMIPNDSAPADVGIWSSTSTDGINWSPPFQLWKGSSWIGLDIAVSRSGKARLVWEAVTTDANNSNVTTLWSSFFGGSVWSNPTVVMPSTVENDHAASVAINAQDQGIIAFVQGDTFYESIWTARFSGATLSAPVLMETSDERAFDPKVYLNGDGRGILFWTTSTGQSGLSSRVFNGDAFLSESRVTSNSIDGVPSAVVDKQGNVTVVWATTQGSTGWNVNASRLPLGGAWTEPVKLETTNRAKLQTNTDPEPCVGIDAAGNVLAVWRRDESTTDDYTFSVWSARLPVGGDWTMSTNVHRLPMLRVLPVSCGMSDNGIGVAAFNYRQDDALNAVNPPTWNVFTAIFR